MLHEPDERRHERSSIDEARDPRRTRRCPVEQRVHRRLAVADRSRQPAATHVAALSQSTTRPLARSSPSRRSSAACSRLLASDRAQTPLDRDLETCAIAQSDATTRGATSVAARRRCAGTAARTAVRRGRRALRARARRSAASDRLDVPLLVEDVGREREVEPLVPRLAPVPDAWPRSARPFRSAFVAQQLDRVGRPVGRDDVRPAVRRDERRHAEPAAELDDPQPVEVGRQRRGQRRRGGPELGPVRQELVVLRTPPRRAAPRATTAGAARARPPPPAPSLRAGRHAAGQSSASSPTVTPGGSEASALEREQDARHVRLARRRVVANRQHLARPAEQHLLVRDEARQAHRMDRHRRRRAARPSPWPCPTARRPSCRGAAR